MLLVPGIVCQAFDPRMNQGLQQTNTVVYAGSIHYTSTSMAANMCLQFFTWLRALLRKEIIYENTR